MSLNFCKTELTAFAPDLFLSPVSLPPWQTHPFIQVYKAKTQELSLTFLPLALHSQLIIKSCWLYFLKTSWIFSVSPTTVLVRFQCLQLHLSTPLLSHWSEWSFKMTNWSSQAHIQIGLYEEGSKSLQWLMTPCLALWTPVSWNFSDASLNAAITFFQ